MLVCTPHDVVRIANSEVRFVFRLDGQEELELFAPDEQMTQFLEDSLQEGRRIRVGVRWDPSYNAKRFPPSQPNLIVLSAQIL
jgi:hypothetical protein